MRAELKNFAEKGEAIRAARYNWTDERVTFFLEQFAAQRQQRALYTRYASDYHRALSVIREEIEHAFPEDRLSHTQISDKYKELRSLYQNFLAFLELPDLEYDEETGKIDAPDAQWSFIRLRGGYHCEKDLRERGFGPARLQLFRSAFPYEQGNTLMMMCSWDSDDDHLLKEILKKKKRAPRGEKKAGEKRKRVTKPASKAKATKVFSEKLKQSIRLGPMREGEEKMPFAQREFTRVKSDVQTRMKLFDTPDAQINDFLNLVQHDDCLMIKYNSSNDGGKRKIFWRLLQDTGKVPARW